MKMPLIAFVCVNYRNSEFTLEFCRSLGRQSGWGEKFDMLCVIVDNSPDSLDSENLRQSVSESKWIKYLPSEENVGYFGGLNLGIEKLPVHDLDFLVLCNNDLNFDDSFCQTVVSKQYGDNVYGVCPDLVTPDGVHQNPHILKRIGWGRRFQLDMYFSNFFIACFLVGILKVLRSIKRKPVLPLVGQEIHMGIGACYVLTRNFLRAFKRLNYPNFLYGEEAYFSEQIHSSGGILWFDPALQVRHAESASLAKIPRRQAYEFAREGYPEYRKLL